MDSADLMRRFYLTLPRVKQWIDNVLEENAEQAVPVADLPYARLSSVFPIELLRKAKVVVVVGKVPFPPLTRMGLPELSQMENMSMAGVTYKDTFFLNHLHQTESLCFHELVHVVQWDRLGVDNFLLAYGIGLMQFGYQNSPFEQIAYSLQTVFDQGRLSQGVVELIQRETDAVWSRVSSVLTGTIN